MYHTTLSMVISKTAQKVAQIQGKEKEVLQEWQDCFLIVPIKGQEISETQVKGQGN